MNNSIYSIKPYKHEGCWVFDDERVGLVKEPFVMGIPEIIDILLAKKKLPENGFNVLFSSCGFPEPDLILQKEEEDAGGNWYKSEEIGLRGWLCPALYLYYELAPENLYIKFIAA